MSTVLSVSRHPGKSRGSESSSLQHVALDSGLRRNDGEGGI